MHKRYYDWVVLASLTACSACGSRLQETGGETSFLACDEDTDCPDANDRCSRGRCVIAAPATTGQATTGQATTGQATTGQATTGQATTGQATTGQATAASNVAVSGESGETDSSGTTSAAVTGVEMIDDMEDPDPPSQSAFFWKRAIGNWFLSTETKLADASRATLDPPRGDSTASYWVTETTGLVDLWAQLSHPQGERIDVSGYSGLSFWSKSNLSGLQVTVMLDGAVRSFGRPRESLDSDLPRQVLVTSPEWQYYEVWFSQLGAATGASTIDFIFDSASGGINVWIDDLALLCDGLCPE